MAQHQRLINVLTIIACTIFLFYLNSSIDQVSSQQDEILQITSLIGNGVALSDKQLEKITTILSKDHQQLKKNSPLCFLKAYEEIVVKAKLNPENIFNLFEPGKQFSGISTCTHYYSLLIYRVARLQTKEKVIIEGILNNLLSKQYQSKQKPIPICIYFYAYNSEITVKEQMAQIIAQEQSSFNAIVDIDGSKDNTHMFVKYTLDERKDKSISIQINTESQRKGFINNLEKIVQKQCHEDSIVLILDKNSVLLSAQSLRIVNNFFESNPNNITLFKSLTINRENIENNIISNYPNIYPVLAFRKAELPIIKPIIKKISAESKEGDQLFNYQYETLTFNLLTDPQLSKNIGFSNDAIIYRPVRKPVEQQTLSKLSVKQ